MCDDAKTTLTLVLLLLFPIQASSKSERFDRLAALAAQQGTTSAAEETSTINFCDLVKRPQRYYDRAVRITAKWESGDEFSYLTDDRCPPGHRDSIAVRFVNDLQHDEKTKRMVEKIMSHEYGGRARVTVVGILRKPFKKYYGYFRYRFDILRFEDTTHLIVPCQGFLQAGKTYRAKVRGDRTLGLSPVPPVRMFQHQSLYIEWTNLSEFPALEELRDGPGERQIVFSVVSDQSIQMTVSRWSRTVQCKIIRIE